MANTIMQEAMKKAFKEKGVDLPAVPVKESAKKLSGAIKLNKGHEKPNNNKPNKNLPKIRNGKVLPRPTYRKDTAKKNPVAGCRDGRPPQKNLPASVSSESRPPKSQMGNPKVRPSPVVDEATIEPPTPDYSLVLQGNSQLMIEAGYRKGPALQKTKKYDGIQSSICKDVTASPVELTLGIDFGTSSTKVVIGDPQQQRAFAVPFVKDDGVDQYLLPGIVAFSQEYSLLSGGALFRDLKLALTGEPDKDVIYATTAFLALVIRHARAWLFEKNESLYKHSFIFWNLVIGTPSDGESNAGYANTIQRLASAAWLVAGKNQPVTEALIDSCLDVSLSDMDAVVSTCPEIAAQMYAFVSSESFDPKGNNIFMMVDVGAGTLDSSVFYVKRKDDESCRFATFASSVDFNGSVNLHRFRLEWLSDAIGSKYPERNDLISSIGNAMEASDCLATIPDEISGYVSNMQLDFVDFTKKPDEVFRRRRVANQVYGVYQKARFDGGVPTHQLTDLPTFYCGGGMRMPFYSIIPSLFNSRATNHSWIRPVPRQLVKPEKLIAPALQSSDYDRLSVAYGLALIGKGEHVTVNKVDPPDIPEPHVASDYTLYSK